MPDTPIDRPEPPSYDPDHETRISRLEDEMREVKSTLGQMLPVLVRIDSMLTATLPHLATKAEVADLRSEMKAEFAAVRAESKSEFTAVRAESKSEFAAVRAESKSEFGAARAESQSGFAGVHTEIAGIASEVAVVRADMAHLATKAELAEKPSKAYLWGILAALIATYGAGLAVLLH